MLCKLCTVYVELSGPACVHAVAIVCRHVWVLFMLLLEVFVATFVPVSVVFGDGQSAFSKVTDVVVAVSFAVDLFAKLLQSRTNAFGERVPPGKGAAWVWCAAVVPQNDGNPTE